MIDEFAVEHDAELEGWIFTLLLDRQPVMVRLVREALRTLMRGRHSADVTETACLLASELVSNALLHTEQPVLVRLRETNGVLRLDARDGDPLQPERRKAAEGEEGGRGLVLLDALATRWGVRRYPDGRGKSVWFELEEAQPWDGSEGGSAAGGFAGPTVVGHQPRSLVEAPTARGGLPGPASRAVASVPRAAST